jgi:hypothetical protein
MMPSRREAVGWIAALPCKGVVGAAASATTAQVRAADFADGRLCGFDVGDVHYGDGAYFDAVAATGARLVRASLPFGRCPGCRHFLRRLRDTEALARLLDMAAARRLKLIVAGSVEGAQGGDFWQDSALQDDWLEQWRRLAAEFGRHPSLAGLDLLNEPDPPQRAADMPAAQMQWRALATRAVAAVRAAGCARPIVFQPVAGASPLGLRGMQPLADAEVIYSIHFYLPHGITHQRVAPQWPGDFSYPSRAGESVAGGDPTLAPGPFDRERLALEMQPAREFQQRHGLTVHVGEFSCVRWAPGESALRWVSDCLELFAERGWSWTYHEFRGWPGWDAELAGSAARRADAPVMRRLRAALQAASR